MNHVISSQIRCLHSDLVGGSRSFGMWQYATDWVVPNIPNEQCTFIFKHQVAFLEWWTLEDEGTIIFTVAPCMLNQSLFYCSNLCTIYIF
jgi:hypothetical protein